MFKKLCYILIFSILCFNLSSFVYAQNTDTDSRVFQNAIEEQRYQHLITELRCPQCQNQSLAGSESVISQSLRKKTYELMIQGKTDIEIKQYMVARYGDFITYTPPVNYATAILWFSPPMLLFLLVIGWSLKKMNKKEQQTLTDIQKQQLHDILKK